MRTHSTTTSTSDDGFRRVEVITGIGRRRRWTDEEKAWIVAESLDPATTTSAVARRYGLHPSQLFVWRQQLAALAARDAPGFVPVLVTDEGTAPAEPGGRIEIVLGPAVVRVGPDVDAAALRRVLEAGRGVPWSRAPPGGGSLSRARRAASPRGWKGWAPPRHKGPAPA